jgi:hypothetical protein
MVEMVHDRIVAGETTVVSTAAILRCGNQMEKLPHYNSLSKTGLVVSLEEGMDLSRDRQIEDSPTGHLIKILTTGAPPYDHTVLSG